MLAITQSQCGLYAEPTQTHFSFDSMPSKFNPPIEPQEESTFPMSNTLNELMLTASLDLFKYPAITSLDLQIIYIFANLVEFCYAITSNRAGLLNLLACIINYNRVIYNKMLAKYGK